MKKRCPNCNQKLEKPPKRKSKCPHCGELIFVRSKLLVSEDRALELDAIVRLDMFDITEIEFLKFRKKLSRRFGKLASIADTKWAIYNDMLTRSMKTSDFQTMKMLYFAMAGQTREEKKPNYKNLLVQSQKMELYEYKKSDYVKKVRTQTVNDMHVCQKCSDYAEVEHKLEDVLKNDTFVASICESIGHDGMDGYCRCWYSPIVEY